MLQADLHGEVASGLLEVTAEQGNSTFSADTKGSGNGWDRCWEDVTLWQRGRGSLAFPLSFLAFYATFCLPLKKLHGGT